MSVNMALLDALGLPKNRLTLHHNTLINIDSSLTVNLMEVYESKPETQPYHLMFVQQK